MSIKDIQNLTSISDNIDVEILSPFLYNAQEMYIRPVCGDALMDAIIVDAETGGTTYETLIENYIFYPLAYATWFSSAPFIAYKTMRKGLVTQSSDNSQNLTTEEMSIYLGRIESTMTFYLRKLRTYLNENKASYPLYCNDDDITPSNSSSIFLGFN